MSNRSDETKITLNITANCDTDEEINLTERAKDLFGFYKDILNGFESYRQCIRSQEGIIEAGRESALSQIDKLNKNCIQVLNYAAENEEILNRSLPSIGPVIICGLPRTGTTLLYNLLNCDPTCRAPTYFDMSVDVVPPIARSDLVQQKKRMNSLISSIKVSEKFAEFRRQLASVHPSYPIEEDYLILRHASYTLFFTYIAINDETKSDVWLQNEMKKDYAYNYHKIFLRMLDSVDTPSSHWLLKSPMHCLHFDTILQHYPNALFVITHRRLDEALPSLCNLSWLVAQWAYDKNDTIQRKRIAKRCCMFADQAVQSIEKFHNSQKQMIDSARKCHINVAYDDLMNNPIEVVRQIYDCFSLKWSDEFETAMHKWLLENPQGKQGRHSYSLKEWNLSCEEIEKRYATYTKLFLSK